MTCTSRGRVVYSRKKHPIGYRALWRIAQRLLYPADDLNRLWYYRLVLDLLLWVYYDLPAEAQSCDQIVRAAVDKLGADLLDSGTFPGFSGGEFGGAGVTRQIHYPWQGNPIPVRRE